MIGCWMDCLSQLSSGGLPSRHSSILEKWKTDFILLLNQPTAYIQTHPGSVCFYIQPYSFPLAPYFGDQVFPNNVQSVWFLKKIRTFRSFHMKTGTSGKKTDDNCSFYCYHVGRWKRSNPSLCALGHICTKMWFDGADCSLYRQRKMFLPFLAW